MLFSKKGKERTGQYFLRRIGGGKVPRERGGALKQQYYIQLQEDMKKHTGMLAIQANKHKECITSMKVNFKGISLWFR